MSDLTVLTLAPPAGMPPRQPLEMPVQDLRRAPERPPLRTPPRVVAARLVTFGGAALLTGLGLYEMIQVVAIGSITFFEGVMTAIFAVTFAWIALAATTALAGVVTPPPRHVRVAAPGGKLRSRTALVMPIYHEDPDAVTAALRAMAQELSAAGEADAFEIVILSDSTSADAWLRETEAVGRLEQALAGAMPVWYRRRWANTAKKAGNVKDFVEQWGGRYDHMIVLDADSLMSAEALITLAAAMEADPGLGILQTVPTLAGGTSLFARLQQFASRVHGPVVAQGLAAWQGSDGNYWGHNAIIRTAAFAAACGLPDLPGKKPFGGPVLSHDFVEAALMRRAGWRVEMTPRLVGSWEGSPPSLIDVAVRDRRWAQGNLQHAKVLRTRGLASASRMHFVIGIMSYLASPLWLLLIASGIALTIQAHLIRPEYFPDGLQLFPTWPRFDSDRMVRLFIGTLGVLLLPKTIGLVRGLMTRELRRGCGGALRLFLSFWAELLISALYAPVMMAIHSRQVYEILVGRDAGWSAQRRSSERMSWGEAWQRHRWHTAFGVGLSVGSYILSPAIFAWLSPTVIGLLLAAPLSRASGSDGLGRSLRDAGLLVIPEELNPPPTFLRRDLAAEDAGAIRGDPVEALATDEKVRAAHFDRIATPPRRRGAPEAAYFTAAEKIRDAHNLNEALAWLDPRERLQVAGHRNLAEDLARLPRGGGPEPEPVTTLHPAARQGS